MLIESEFTFDVPPDVVYEGLMDAEILAGALPGTETLDRVGEDRYEGRMEASVGPVTAARFDVVVELRDKVPAERFDMHVDGKGKAGFVQGVANIRLEPHESGTLMKYRADLQVGGRVAGVGQRLLDSVGKSMSRQGLETVNRTLTARSTPAEVAVADAAPPAPRRRNLVPLLVAAIVIALALVLLL